MDSNQTGAISEIAVELDLLKRGFNILIPRVTTRYDRIVETNDGRYIRVQIKTARVDRRDGNLRVTYDTPYYAREVDVIAVFDPNGNDIYYVPIQDLPNGAKGFTLRVTPRIYKRVKRSGLDAANYTEFNLKFERRMQLQ